MSEGYYKPKPKPGTRKFLISKAMAKINRMNKKELKNFLKINCCPHEKVYRCGMDSVCLVCGDWV